MASSASGRSRRIRSILNWSVSLLLAGWAVSLIHSVAVTHPPPQVWDEELGRIVLASGYEWTRNQEGYGSSSVGKHGILGLADATASPHPKVLIWGDSYIEGMEVHDAERAPQVLTRIWNEHQEPDITAVGLGSAGWSLADHYFLLPRYKAVIPNCAVDVFVLSGLGDVLPNQASAIRSRFLHREGAFSLVKEKQADISPASTRRQEFLYRWRLRYPVWFVRHQGPDLGFGDLRFAPGPVRGKRVTKTREDFTPEFVREAFDYILGRIATRSSRPTLFVLMPTNTPVIAAGQVVTREETQAYEEVFRAACRRTGFDFVALRREFNQAWREERRLPRGFSNSIPGEGHLNAVGHRIVAQAIARYLEENLDALHTD